ncbi:MAG: BTAD domain-containing putative transcriptional regulator [Gaiellaceae bacterium]
MDRARPIERQLEFLILGPLEVRSEGRALELRSAKQRSLLAILLLSANEFVSSERLTEELWPGGPPEKASNVLQVHVSQLRKALTPGLLATRAGGYALAVEPEQIDSVRFERLVNEGIAAVAMDDPSRALQTLERSLALWRGSALSDFAFEDFARTEAGRLEELRLLAVEERFDAALALGRHAALAGELEAFVAANPLRERPAGQLMLALYRSRRQAEALDAYSRTRQRLVDELGIDPTPELQRLERAILNQDASLALPEPVRPAPVASPAPPAHEIRPPTPQTSRKTVTVVFVDFALTPTRGATVEPETLEPVFSSLGDELARVVEQHGGSIHWSSEIEIVAVFGLPRVHEDDALRAVRASVELREAIAGLSPRLECDFGVRVDVRVGVNTGQVVAGMAFASPAMGGASSVAARLGRAAAVGEILIADTTKELVRDAVTVEAAESGWRLLDVFGALGVERRLEVPTVGREEEVATLRRAFDAVVRDRSPSIVTVLGPPGIGKSHLARAFAEGLDGSARVLVGRSASYGEGSTFAPLAEIVRRLGGESPLDAIRGIVASDDEPDVVVERIAAAIGLSDSGGQTETTFWAVRKLFEALARDTPLVVLLDDLHWADPTFLDLVEYVVDWAFDSPILLLGLSRPELLEERPNLAGAGRNASALALKPLGAAESEALVDNLLDGSELDARRRALITDAAAGNPFFLEQMVAMHTVENASPIAIPPTIQALLAARLDRLEPDQLAVLELASIMGKEFWPSALAELASESPSALNATLRELVRKQLIEPARSTIPVADALRFHSGLIRDAVYESVPKRARAALHEQVAAWLARTVGEQAVGQFAEALGHHFEQAYRYLGDLGPRDEHARAVGRSGADNLSAAGRRAFARGDMAVASALLLRAAALLQPDVPARLELLPTIGEALQETGDFKRSLEVLDEAIESGDAKAPVIRALVQASSGAGSGDAIVREAKRAIAVFEPARDDAGLATAYRMLAWAHGTEGRYGDAAEAARRAIEHADAADDTRQNLRASTLYALSALHGPTPVSEAIERCRHIVEDVAGDRRAEGLVTIVLGWLEAMGGDFDGARELAGRGRAILDDLGTNVLAASTISSEIEMLAGDPAAAERDLRRDFDALTELGETYLRSTVAGDLAQAVYLQGRHDEALDLATVAEELAAEDDVISQAFWRSVRAKVLAQRARADEALPLAEQAVDLIRGTDSPVTLARTLVDLAEVQSLGDRSEDAYSALAEAAALLERKENVVAAQRAAERLEALGGAPARYIM